MDTSQPDPLLVRPSPVQLIILFWHIFNVPYALALIVGCYILALATWAGQALSLLRPRARRPIR